jgi:predicted PolB exonuclease-like 3'-5' exonuclease
VIRFLARDVVCWDTETVPDIAAGRRMHGMNSEIEDMFRAHPDYDAETNPRPFLKPVLQQVVSLAYVRRTVENGVVTVKLMVNEGAEPNMIEGFLKGIGRYQPQLVGYNSESFDLPLLIQRALVHGLSVPAFCKRPDKPWEGKDYFGRYSDWHIDLMHELGGFGRSVPSLSEACAALNILGGAKDVTGADVLDLYLAGDLAAIHRYCATDAVRHFLILLRLCVLAGHVTPEQALAETLEVTRQLEALTAPAELAEAAR